MPDAVAPVDPLRFLQGGGICGALARSTDWSATPLGPPEQWPVSLKTIVATILNSRHPMFLWWGEDPDLQRCVPAELRQRQAPWCDGPARCGVLAGDLADHLAADPGRDATRHPELARGCARADLPQRAHRGCVLDIRLFARIGRRRRDLRHAGGLHRNH